MNEVGCYSGLRKPFPKELNLRLIFTLRPDFSEVCFPVAQKALFTEFCLNCAQGQKMLTLEDPPIPGKALPC